MTASEATISEALTKYVLHSCELVIRIIRSLQFGVVLSSEYSVTEVHFPLELGNATHSGSCLLLLSCCPSKC